MRTIVFQLLVFPLFHLSLLSFSLYFLSSIHLPWWAEEAMFICWLTLSAHRAVSPGGSGMPCWPSFPQPPCSPLSFHFTALWTSILSWIFFLFCAQCSRLLYDLIQCGEQVELTWVSELSTLIILITLKNPNVTPHIHLYLKSYSCYLFLLKRNSSTYHLARLLEALDCWFKG